MEYELPSGYYYNIDKKIGNLLLRYFQLSS